MFQPLPQGVYLCGLPIPTSSQSLGTSQSITMDPLAGPTAWCHWSQISQQRRCWGLGDHSPAGDPHSEPPASPKSPWERGMVSLYGKGARKRRQMRGLQSLVRGTAHRKSQGSPEEWEASGLQGKKWSVSLGRQGSSPQPPEFLVSRSIALFTPISRSLSLTIRLHLILQDVINAPVWKQLRTGRSGMNLRRWPGS